MATCQQCGKIYNDGDGVDNPFKDFCSDECEQKFYKEKMRIAMKNGLSNFHIAYTNSDKPEQVEHPSRYNRKGIEVWDIEKAFANKDTHPFVEHLRFGAIEYILRCWDKNGAEDIKKAMFLLNRMLTEMEGGEK